MDAKTTSPGPGAAAGTVADRQLRIDMWSDLSCPWCYLGKHRLEKAIGSSRHAGSIKLVTRSFELDPGISGEPVPILEVVAAKMGMPPVQAERLEAQMATLVEGEGLPYTSDRMHANSFDAHRVLHLAADHDLGEALLSVLQRELFSGRANVYDHAVLVSAAAGLGIPRARVEEVLAGGEYADAVRRDEEDARQLGVTGVPFTVLDGRFAISGAATVDGYAKAIEQAWGDQ
jgi:predicted DsbA family dithiol-disulfide isomerase